MRNLARTGPHVRDHNRRAFIQHIEERIEAFGRVNIHLTRLVTEVMREAAARLVLRIQIEQLVRNLVAVEPLDQAGDEGGFPDTSLPALRENDAARGFGNGLDCGGHRRLLLLWFGIERERVLRIELKWLWIGS